MIIKTQGKKIYWYNDRRITRQIVQISISNQYGLNKEMG